MVNIQVVRTVVGIIGNIISLGLFLSPFPTFIRIVKKKDVEEFQPLPYLATAFNCMMWVFYGLPIVHPNSTLVWTINGVGLAIELAYLIIYLMYAPKNKKLSTMGIFALEVVCMFIIVLCVLLFAHTHEKRSLVVGILAIILCICMYSAPLGVMRMVIKTKSVEYMPFYLSLASFLNGVCWTIYGFMPVDVNLIVPNGMGALLGAVQLILYACFYKTTPRLGSDGHVKQEVQMSSVPTGSVAIDVRS